MTTAVKTRLKHDHKKQNSKQTTTTTTSPWYTAVSNPKTNPTGGRFVRNIDRLRNLQHDRWKRNSSTYSSSSSSSITNPLWSLGGRKKKGGKMTHTHVPYRTAYITPSRGGFFRLGLLDNQQGANSERYMFGKLSTRCFQRLALWHRHYSIPTVEISNTEKSVQADATHTFHRIRVHD